MPNETCVESDVGIDDENESKVTVDQEARISLIP